MRRRYHDVGDTVRLQTAIWMPLLAAALMGLSAAAWRSVQEYKAPDGRAVAIVQPAPRSATEESQLEIRDAAGAELARKSFASPDGSHGLSIVRAAWSPDSQFFVFITTSSGGHQPWHSPTFAYSRGDNVV
jgi:hypothetical protein